MVICEETRNTDGSDNDNTASPYISSARLEAGTPKTPKSRKEDRAFFGSSFNQLEALAEAASLQKPHGKVKERTVFSYTFRFFYV